MPDLRGPKRRFVGNAVHQGTQPRPSTLNIPTVMSHKLAHMRRSLSARQAAQPREMAESQLQRSSPNYWSSPKYCRLHDPALNCAPRRSRLRRNVAEAIEPCYNPRPWRARSFGAEDSRDRQTPRSRGSTHLFHSTRDYYRLILKGAWHTLRPLLK